MGLIQHQVINQNQNENSRGREFICLRLFIQDYGFYFSSACYITRLDYTFAGTLMCAVISSVNVSLKDIGNFSKGIKYIIGFYFRACQIIH